VIIFFESSSTAAIDLLLRVGDSGAIWVDETLASSWRRKTEDYFRIGEEEGRASSIYGAGDTTGCTVRTRTLR
jgi:hypothetical protein